MIKKCSKCGSYLVCWNWFHADRGDYGHECWSCENALITDEKVRNGIPYWLLCLIFKYKN